MGLGCQRHAPAALPPGKTRYPLYRRLGGPPRTVQHVASRYTDYVIVALNGERHYVKIV